MILRTGLIEQQFNVPPQMVNARRGYLAGVFGLGQDERALDGGLGVEGQALRGPVRVDAALAHGFLNVRHQSCRVPADAPVAGLAQRRMRVVDLLHHGSDQAGEVGQIALNMALRKST